MVYAVINISEHTNQILNIVKARYGLRTKAQAIEKMTVQYAEEVLGTKLRPEFIKKAEESMHTDKRRRIKRVLDIFE